MGIHVDENHNKNVTGNVQLPEVDKLGVWGVFALQADIIYLKYANHSETMLCF